MCVLKRQIASWLTVNSISVQTRNSSNKNVWNSRFNSTVYCNTNVMNNTGANKTILKYPPRLYCFIFHLINTSYRLLICGSIIHSTTCVFVLLVMWYQVWYNTTRAILTIYNTIFGRKEAKTGPLLNKVL